LQLQSIVGVPHTSAGRHGTVDLTVFLA